MANQMIVNPTSSAIEYSKVTISSDEETVLNHLDREAFFAKEPKARREKEKPKRYSRLEDYIYIKVKEKEIRNISGQED